MTAQELQSLVAPIALYPDTLVAPILSAATFPDQVAVADNWLQQNKNLTGTALGQAVTEQYAEDTISFNGNNITVNGNLPVYASCSVAR